MTTWAFATEVLEATWVLCTDMAPYLLLGFVAAGLLHGFVPLSLLSRHLGGESKLAVFRAAILGVPLPLCSCGVLPVAASLRSSGVGRAPTVAFLITTPVTGVDSLLATWGVLGGAFAIARLTASLVIGVLVGLATRMLRFSKEVSTAGLATDATWQPIRQTTTGRLRDALRYGFWDLPGEIAGSLMLGLLLGGLITVLVPADALGAQTGSGMVGMLVAVSVAVPLYVCATGSLPIAAAMMMKGFSPGAALAFLLAGPATNTVALATVRKLLGTKVLVVYLAGILLGAVGFGIGLDVLSSGAVSQVASTHGHGAEASPGVLSLAAGGLLLAVLIAAWARRSNWWRWLSGRTRALRQEASPMTRKIRLTVPAMDCAHCKRTVIAALREIEGVHAVQVDLDGKSVLVSADEGVPASRLTAELSRAGYDASLEN